ncbi:MAG: hypothetical protein D6759_16715 [Chloroflexi bacterium]|nr:MAG: hypothetical protein D6759_16715 [Chloroflexota bacterium]
MSTREDLLQERLERLEAGYPLEACLVGLPEEEAEALKLAARLRELARAEQSQAVVAAQRAALLNAAAATVGKRQDGRAATGTEPGRALAWLEGLRTGLDRLLSRREVAFGAAFLFLCAFLAFAWVGLRRGWSEETEPGGATLVASSPLFPTATPVAEGIHPTETVTPAVASREEELPYGVFLPLVSRPLPLGPQIAALQELQGIVEVQADGETWTRVTRPVTVTVGQRVRTGALSRATLLLFDGSQVHLGPETELSIDELDARRPGEGPRTVVLTQWVGESEHRVQPREERGSRYEVKTPAGSGVARGTAFRVLVTPSLLVRFVVIEGKVDVTGLNRTVAVIAGQVTTVIAGRVPEWPRFRITGEGVVSQTGTVWVIAGQSFQTGEHTIIVGNPQVGDLVRVEGHLLPDGERMADRIILLRRAPSNRFEMKGEVEAMGATAWTVAGRTIVLRESTEVHGEIEVGDSVLVEGLILEGGTLLAERITLLEEAPGLPFSFVGVVQEMESDAWTISGKRITLDAETEVDDAVAVGDLVTVRGWILDDDTWLARSIERVREEEHEFAFTGIVESIAPWSVSGIAFETREWTVVDPGIEVGDRVRVRGIILDDGTWVATVIEALDAIPTDTIVWIGVVDSVDPWVVNGIPLLVDDSTVIGEGIVVGSVVRVEIALLSDGTWRVVSIHPVRPDFGVGCLIVSTTVVGARGDEIVLWGWPKIKLERKIKVKGHIKADSVVTFPICFLFDGTPVVGGEIVVIYEPVVITVPAPAPPPLPPPSEPRDRHHHWREHHDHDD